MKNAISACISILLLAFASSALAQGKPEKERINIGYAAKAVVHAIPFVTKEAGLFREEGIQADIVRTAGNVAPMTLVSGDVSFSIMSAFLLLPAAQQYRDLVMLAGFTRYASMYFVTRPEIKNAGDLRGKIIGLQRPGDAYEKNARVAVRHLGLDPDKDVKFLYVGGNEVMWTALESRRVGATMLTPPSTLFARKAGMNFLVNLSDLKVEYQGSSMTTRRSFLKENPNLAFRAVRAMVRGIHFFKTRKEETLKILAKFFGTNDREALEESWDYASDVPTKPYASESAVQAVIDHLAELNPRFGRPKPADFIDSGPLAELDKSGFIDRLYAAK
ncbi:MAG TPA: ABC transporter substrate-binding protein [Candidatus Binatia bacterium]|nr:ABC transporter substrate-binding protein [Candidatus Binatia bacterium]